MRKLTKKIKYLDNKGNTMFETIVAFFILTIILALIYQMISFCGELRMKAADTSQVYDEFNQDMYRKDVTVSGSSIDATKRSSSDAMNGPLFYIELSEETSDANMKTNNVSDFIVASRTDNPYRLKMKNLHAYSLVSNDSRIDEMELVTPKAVQFFFEK
ncbi:MAG: hypothetical protein IJ749_03575 [Eubacterium sp.]|nr:hypothetical protein [Eubacterium sp.]